MKTVSVSLVSYNSGHTILEALASLFREVQGVNLQVFVVDNASSDDTIEKVRAAFPDVTVIPLSENRGFGGGHNAVSPLLCSDYHLVLNPDVVFTYDALTPLCEWLDTHEDAVLVTPLILNPDGTRQAVPRVLPRLRYMLSRPLARLGGPFRKWRNEYTMNGSDFDSPTDITFCTGCFMLLRTSVWQAVGGFDEDFFLYCEDADLSRRLLPYGRLVCLPDQSVTHEWERGSSKNPHLRRLHQQAIVRYFTKWKNREATKAPSGPVSVAMATYNGEKYVRRQLESVLAALSEEDEVVVSDDGSTDNTPSIVQEIAENDRRVRLIDGPRKGVIRNFEHALGATRGEVVFLCDQDDVWDESKRRAVLLKMAQTAAAVVVHDARLTDADGKETAPSFFAYHGTKSGFWHNLLRNNFVGCCMAVRRDLLVRALPFPSRIPMHDQWIGLMAEKHGGTAWLSKPLLDYRRHGENATSVDKHGSPWQMLCHRWRLWRSLRHRS